MRRRNSLISIFCGICAQIILLGFSFVMRTIFITQLGAEYLGLFTLFAEMFSVLTIVDGGLLSAVFLKIYKPLEENDQPAIQSVFKLIKVIYWVRGLLIFLLGCIVFFFLPAIVRDTSIDMLNIRLYYIVYMILDSLKYGVIYYMFFMEAVQKRYQVTFVQTIVQICSSLLISVSLFYMQNFYIYIVLSIGTTLVAGQILKCLAIRQYPFLKQKTKIRQEDKRDIKSMLLMSVHTVSGSVVKNTDSILITSLCGVAANGLFSNYRLLSGQVSMLLGQASLSIKDSMRSLMAEGNKTRVCEMIDNITYLYFWLAGICTVCLTNLSSPFISLWLGAQYTISFSAALFLSLSIYFTVVSYPLIDAYYYERCFVNDKASPVIEAVINLAFSIVFGLMWGIEGVMFGTVMCYSYQITRRSKVFYNSYIAESNSKFIKKYMGYLLRTTFSIFLVQGIIDLYFKKQEIWSFLCSAIICVVVTSLVFLMSTLRSKELAYLVKQIVEIANLLTKKYLGKK